MRRIIIPSLFSVILFFWGPLSVIVRAFNLRRTEGSFVALVAVCCVELCVILAVWEIAVFHSYLKLQGHIEDIGRDAVRKRNVGIAIFSIRLNRKFCMERSAFLVCAQILHCVTENYIICSCLVVCCVCMLNASIGGLTH